MIRVELKKLYENAPADVVHHFHSHSVSPPVGNIEELRAARNVASRTRRIVYSLASFWEILAKLMSEILNSSLTSQETVRLSRVDLDYLGWWEFPKIETVARHIPEDLTEEKFLDRCKVLHQLVIEGFSESVIRKSIETLGFDKNKTKELRSLKLLSIFMAICEESKESGLVLLDDTEDIINRISSGNKTYFMPTLFTLNDLRVISAHRGDKSHSKKLNEALEVLEIDIVSTTSGWGHVLDKIYDEIAQEIDKINSILQQVDI